MKVRKRFRKVIIVTAIFILLAILVSIFQKIKPERKLSVKEVLESFSPEQLKKVVFEVDESSVVFDPWLNSFTYRKAITIDNTANTNDLTDYQVLVNLDTANLIGYTIYELPITISSTGVTLTDYQVNITITDPTILSHMTSDGRGIRVFNQSTSNPYSDTLGKLNFWIESISPSQLKLWVKVDQIPASGGKTIYMYYGNLSATSASNATNTLLIYEDWSSGTLGTWTLRTTAAGYLATIVTTEGNPPPEVKIAGDNFAGDFNQFIYKTITKPAGIGLRLVADHAGYHGYYTSDVWTMYYIYTTSNTNIESYNYAGDANNVWIYNDQWLATSTNTLSNTTVWVGFGLNDGWAADWSQNARFDNIRVMLYTSPEPTTSLGAETIKQEIVGKMRSDCGDIRFTDGTTQLSYWVESGCNTTSTKIWVKVPSIPANSTKTIYVYYGNPSASSASNGDNTFIFFDDFSTDPNTNDKWLVYRNANITSDEFYWDSTNRQVYLTKAINSRGTMAFFNKQFSPYNTITEFQYLAGGGSGADGFSFYFDKNRNPYATYGKATAGGSLGCEAYDGTNAYLSEGYGAGFDNTQNAGDPSANHIEITRTNSTYNTVDLAGAHLATYNTAITEDNTWHSAKIVIGSNFVEMWIDGTNLLSYTGLTALGYNWQGFGAGTGSYNNNHIIKMVKIRKYTSPEPTTSIGAEDVLITQAGSPTSWQWKIPAQGEKIRSGSATSWEWKTFTNDGTGIVIPRGSVTDWQWGP